MSHKSQQAPEDDPRAAYENDIQQLHDDERAALLRVAGGLATKSDAMLLAGSLMHSDLFTQQEPTMYGYNWEER